MVYSLKYLEKEPICYTTNSILVGVREHGYRTREYVCGSFEKYALK